MGQRQSSALPSREEILAKTKGGTDLVDQIFNWMVQNVSLRELYSLANPERCKEYIFLTADALDVLFKKIAIEPKEGAKGVIYFQKIEDLVKPKTPEDPRALQRQRICVKLAFLYVRIFQVFAALALSILDVDTKSELQLYEGLGRLQAGDSVPLFGRQPTRGGALANSYDIAGDLEGLRSVLTRVPTNPRIYQLEGTNVFLEWQDTTLDGTKVLFQYRLPTGGATKTMTARVRGEGGDNQSFTLYFSDITDADGRQYANETLRFTRSFLGDPWRRSSRTIPDSVQSAFRTILQKGTQAANARYAPGSPYAYDADRRSPDRDSGRVAEGLHTKTLLEAFKQTPPVKAHCVARALQLLSEAGLRQTVPADVYSSVCKLKFMSANRSLPAAGESVTKSYGIYALAQLFYDTLPGISPEIAASTRAQYNVFLTQMKFVFEEQQPTRPPTSLEEVRNKLPSGVCDVQRSDRSLVIRNRDLIRQLRVDAARMIQYQIGHTANVVKVLQQLFLLPVKAGERLRVHPNIMKGGLNEVNRIAEVARNLLVDYYSQCEIMYRHGAELLANPANRQLIQVV